MSTDSVQSDCGDCATSAVVVAAAAAVDVVGAVEGLIHIHTHVDFYHTIFSQENIRRTSIELSLRQSVEKDLTSFK